MDIEKLKYPIGKFQKKVSIDDADRARMIADIKSFPQRLTTLVTELSEDQLNTPYRPDGWTVRQLVHHLADSHVNSYIRFRWALTEDTPTIKAYEEKSWAELPDAKGAHIKFSLNLLKAIHARWTLLLERMTKEDFSRELSHPEWQANLSLDDMLQVYQWHCEHHLNHIIALIEREQWM
jgi:Mycothiol maleylpyruvate isomerase N-terminal domain.